MNLSELRKTLTDLFDTTEVNVYWYVPAALIAPAVIVVPSEPYIEVLSIGKNKYKANFDLTFAVGMQDNQAALDNIENLIFSAIAALPVGWTYSAASQPIPQSLGQADFLVSKISVSFIQS